MSTHYVVVEESQAYLDHCRKRGITPLRADIYRWRIECGDRAACPAWVKCDGVHADMDPEDEDSPAYDLWEDVEIHGVVHQWRWGHSWTISLVGCAAEGREGLMDLPDGIAHDRPGRWLVDVDWDDDECVLSAVEEAPVLAHPGRGEGEK